MNEWADILDEPALALLMGGAATGPLFPANGSQFTQVTGLTAESLYVFDEPSGSLVDRAGSANLSVSGAPAFDYSVEGRRGIRYSGTSDVHGNAVNLPGTESIIYAGVVAVGTKTGAMSVTGLFGYFASSNEGFAVYMFETTDYFNVRVKSGASEISVTDSSLNIRGNRLFLLSMQVDRAAAQVRYRLSRPGMTPSTGAGSISGFGSLNGSGIRRFGAGKLPIMEAAGDNSVFWLAAMRGAQCEGAGKLADLNRALGWE